MSLDKIFARGLDINAPPRAIIKKVCKQVRDSGLPFEISKLMQPEEDSYRHAAWRWRVSLAI
jgi:hypothetical protein